MDHDFSEQDIPHEDSNKGDQVLYLVKGISEGVSLCLPADEIAALSNRIK